MLFVSFHLQISRFTEIILEKDTNEEYKYFRVEENPSRPTLLHLAAEQNFLHVTKLLVEKYPTLVYLETEVVGDYERGYLPVEKALMCYKDETAAYLISQMKHDWWVQTPGGTLYFRVNIVRRCTNVYYTCLPSLDKKIVIQSRTWPVQPQKCVKY